MSESKLFWKHGLKGTTKQRVFDALFQIQQGRCAICGISDKELVEQCADNPQWMRSKNVCYRFYIDHCHATGCIRGLLCNNCNTVLGSVENYGLFRYYSAPGFLNEPCTVDDPQEVSENILRSCCAWLEKHKGAVLLYMQ